MPTLLPTIAVATTCERILHEDDNVFSVIRVVDTYKLKTVKIGPQPKAAGSLEDHGNVDETAVQRTVQALDISALIMVRAGKISGEHTMKFAVRNPGNKVTEMPSSFPVNFATNDPVEAATATLRFIMPGQSPAGVYWIDVFWDEEPLVSIPIKIMQEPESSQDQH